MGSLGHGAGIEFLSVQRAAIEFHHYGLVCQVEGYEEFGDGAFAIHFVSVAVKDDMHGGWKESGAGGSRCEKFAIPVFPYGIKALRLQLFRDSLRRSLVVDFELRGSPGGTAAYALFGGGPPLT